MAKANVDELKQDIVEETKAATAEAPAVDPLEEMVEVFIPKVSGEATTKFVGLNGQSWLIPCGKRVKVPMKVKLILDESDKLREEADEFSAEEQKKLHQIQGMPGVMI